MLTGVQIVFMGGDARQSKSFKSSLRGCNSTLVGFDKLVGSVSRHHTRATELLKRWTQSDVLILPVVGCDEQGKSNVRLFS